MENQVGWMERHQAKQAKKPLKLYKYMGGDLDDEIATRDAYGEALAQLGEEIKDIVVLRCRPFGVHQDISFCKKFPSAFNVA